MAQTGKKPNKLLEFVEKEHSKLYHYNRTSV